MAAICGGSPADNGPPPSSHLTTGPEESKHGRHGCKGAPLHVVAQLLGHMLA